LDSLEQLGEATRRVDVWPEYNALPLDRLVLGEFGLHVADERLARDRIEELQGGPGELALCVGGQRLLELLHHVALVDQVPRRERVGEEMVAERVQR
jgi:hypothetical protein